MLYISIRENKLLGGFTMGLKDLFRKKDTSAGDEGKNTDPKENEVSLEKQEAAKEVMQEETAGGVEEQQTKQVKESQKSGMITEERRKEIGPIILKQHIEEEDLEALNIQETIFLLCSVDHFNEQSGIENYEEKCELLDRVLAKKLADAETLYMTFDKLTNYPFITQGCVEIYSDMAYARDAVDHYAEQYRVIETHKITKGMSSFPNQMSLFEYLHYLGMEHILVDNGRFKTVVERQDICPMEKRPEEFDITKPVMNPQLRFAIIDFFEEARWPVSYEKREENMKKKEDKMLAQLKKSKFLVPMCYPDEKVEKEQNQVEFKPGKNMILAKVETKEHVSYTPLFTDWVEFAKIYKPDRWNGLVLSFEEAIQLNKDMGIVVNPMGENLIMNQQSFEAMKAQEAKEE